MKYEIYKDDLVKIVISHSNGKKGYCHCNPFCAENVTWEDCHNCPKTVLTVINCLLGILKLNIKDDKTIPSIMRLTALKTEYENTK